MKPADLLAELERGNGYKLAVPSALHRDPRFDEIVPKIIGLKRAAKQ